MKKLIFFLIITLSFAINYNKQEQEFLKNHPVIYFSAMEYWPVNSKGESIHTNYIKLLNKYGNLNIQPIFYKYWSDGFIAAKKGETHGIMALSFSKERTKYFFFTPAYNYTPYYLIVRKDSLIKNFKDLKNKKVFIAKKSIIREIIKNPHFKIIYSKTPYKDLISGKIDAILTFYMPQNPYIKHLKTIKAFINKAGEEHIGISKKYPILYSIILKAQKEIPYKEIEKIKEEYYFNPIPPIYIITPKVTLKELIDPIDIFSLVIGTIFLFLVLYFYLTRKYLNLPLKKFLATIFIIESLILATIVYEIFMFNYYSNKVLELKSRSFNELFLTDLIQNSIIELNNEFQRELKYHHSNYKKFFKGEINANNLLVSGKPLKEYLNPKVFHPTTLAKIGELKIFLDKLLKLQKQVLENKADISLYQANYNYLLHKFQIIKNSIYNENKKEEQIIKEKLKYQFMLMILIALIFVFTNILLFIMIRKKIYKPITYLTQTIKNFKRNKKTTKQFFYKDEVGILIDEFFSLQKALNKNIKSLENHKKNLEEKVKQEVEKRIHQEELLLKRSRLALMGEMIDAIAHQWKQPLTTLKLFIDLYKNNHISKEELIHNISLQIEHMQNTLNEFRTFFQNKQKKEFCIKDIIEKTLLLLKDELISNQIKIIKDIKSNFCIKGLPNEFQHLLISIITNSKEAFIQRNISDKKIKISTYEDKNYYYLEIEDNAGGIDENIIDKIFDLNFSTKNGSGIGLYIANQIAIKHTGTLSAKNSKKGVKIIFKIRKKG